MRVLITGASGFIGRHVLADLRERGIETVSVGRQASHGIEASTFIHADLLATEEFADLITRASATHLLHLAWYVEHGKYWTSPLNLKWVSATGKLVEAFCRGGGQRVVVAGTCAEYDWTDGYCRENSTPLTPASLYGVAKDASRRQAMAICEQYDVSCAWGRLFSPFGAGESSRRLVPSLIDALRGKRSPFGVNETACRDFLHASDVANGFATLLQAKEASVAYNVSSGQPAKISDVVQILASLLGADPTPILGLGVKEPDRYPLLVGENRRLKELGWKPRFSLAMGLERTISDISNVRLA